MVPAGVESAAVGHGHRHAGRQPARETVLGPGGVAEPLHEAADAWVPQALRRVSLQTHFVEHASRRHEVGEAEPGAVGRRRIELGAQGLAHDGHLLFDDLTLNGLDVFGPQPVHPLQLEYCIDEAVAVVTARMELERDVGGMPGLAKIGEDGSCGADVGTNVDREQAELALEDLARRRVAPRCQLGGDDAAMCRPAAVERLGVGAVNHRLQQAARLVAGEAKGVAHLARVQPHGAAGRSGGTKHSDEGRRLDAQELEPDRIGEADAQRRLKPGDDGHQRLAAGPCSSLGRRKGGRDGHRVDVQHAWRVGVVVIEAVAHDATGEGRRRRRQLPLEAGNAGLRLATPGRDRLQDRLCRGQLQRRQLNAQVVEDPRGHVRDHGRRYVGKGLSR